MTSGDLGKGISKWKKEHFKTPSKKADKMGFINRHNIPTSLFTYHGKRKKKGAKHKFVLSKK